MTNNNRETVQVKITHPDLVSWLLERSDDEFMSPTEYVKRLLVADYKENNHNVPF